jgi:hypothetical protein
MRQLVDQDVVRSCVGCRMKAHLRGRLPILLHRNRVRLSQSPLQAAQDDARLRELKHRGRRDERIVSPVQPKLDLSPRSYRKRAIYHPQNRRNPQIPGMVGVGDGREAVDSKESIAVDDGGGVVWIHGCEPG